MSPSISHRRALLHVAACKVCMRQLVAVLLELAEHMPESSEESDDWSSSHSEDHMTGHTVDRMTD